MADLTTITDTDLDVLTLDDLADLRQKVATVFDRKLLLLTAEERADDLARDYQTATGVEDGDAWVQPTGAHNAVPLGATRTHDGKLWLSITPSNVWTPGVSGWREVTDDGSPAEWVAPTGSHDAYQIGDRVTYQGDVYASLIDGNTYSPTDYPAGWAKE